MKTKFPSSSKPPSRLIFRRLVRANRVQSRVVSREYYDWPPSEMAKKSILVRFGSLALPFSVTDKSEFSGMNPGPLVLVNPILEKIDIQKIVNLHCPADPRLEIPVGDVIYALVANRLCSPEPLVHVGEWVEYSGAEFLLGTPAEALNDDRPALDAIFLKRWNILADIALHVSKRFNVSLAKAHYDPTSFHFTGEYDEQSDDPSLLPSIKPFKIEVGDHIKIF